MSAAENKAVFLSYASQDAAAAQRICEALRSAGVEVWFDQNELVGGDAWDAKIRKQIKDCALFVPMISAATQARAEGYFRREWKLAVERTHDMADHVAFLVPVVIDGTGDAEAFVPEKFREVQWTRLPGGEPTPKFCDRVQVLLHGGPARSVAAAVAGGSKPASSPAAAPARPRWRMSALAGVGAAIAVGGWLWFGRTPPKPAPGGSPAVAAAPTPAAAPLTEAQKLTRQARSLIDDPMDVRENYFLADELARRAVSADPADGEAWAVSGRVSALMVRRKFDTSAARRDQMRMQVERALSLAPNSVDGALAQAMKEELAGRRAEAFRVLEDLTKRAPEDRRGFQALGQLLVRAHRNSEALEVFRRVQAMTGGDPLCAALEAMELVKQLRLAEAAAKFEQTLATQPTRSAYFSRMLMLSIYVYDVPAMKAFIERVPARVMQEDGVISTLAEFFLRTGEGDRALAELRRMPRDFFEDGWDWRPKGYLTGYAHQIQGQTAAAQAEWKQALAVVEKRLAAEPNEARLLYWKCVLQGLTGQVAEGKAGRRLLHELSTGERNDKWFDAILLVALGEREEAIEMLVAHWPKTFAETRNDLWGDFLYAPWFAAIRDDPRIRAMAAEHQAAIKRALLPSVTASPAAKADEKSAPAEKSVAVLAFDNRSDDKDAEYFSDGISEELINALGRVAGLTVKGRTSAFFFKGKNATAQEIADKLGVAYLVRGSVRKAGGRVRITAQLSRAATDELVWSSEPLEREVKDVFAVQDEIVGLIAKSLSVQMGVPSRAVHQVNPDALTALLQGRQIWVQRTPEGFARARGLFNRAVTLDSGWAVAHAALASLEAIEASYLRGNGGSVDERMALATREAKRALELDATLGEPHATLGKIAMEYRRHGEAEQEFRRALELEPNNALVHDWYGDFANTQGRLDVATAEYRRAMELEPLSPYIIFDLSWQLLNVRRYGESLALVERAASLTPTGTARYSLRRARLLLELGRNGEAETALRAYLEGPMSGSDPQFINEAAWCLRAFASAADRERLTAELLRRFPDTYASGVIRLMLGQLDQAFPLLEKVPPIFLQQIYWESVFDPVRATPRFRQLLEKLDIVEQYQVARETQERLLKANGPGK